MSDSDDMPMSDSDDMRGPWVLALGMVGIALATVGASAVRRLARRQASTRPNDALDTPPGRADDPDR